LPVQGSFGERLAAHVELRQSQLVLGLDPDPATLWPGLPQADAPELSGVAAAGPRAVGSAVLAQCRALIDAAGVACVAVKPQLACFERLGPAGWPALRASIEHAREAGLLVILDGKRGDIATTAGAYAQALFAGVQTQLGEVDGLEADLVTVNPLMGSDTVEPFVRAARGTSGGVLALVRTSNPGASEIEDLELGGGEPVWERLACLVDQLGRSGTGERGLSDVGAVIGATKPKCLARARELMPRAPFLLPGVGAQGGSVEDLAAAFAPGRAWGLIAASRSIADAHEQAGGTPAAAALAEAERLRRLAWELV
jgi:orotidine-5'-phosphate decarboxylase